LNSIKLEVSKQEIDKNDGENVFDFAQYLPKSGWLGLAAL